jgi:hypothetical protein
MPGWVLGLANAGIVIVGYGLAGLAGYWFARQLGLPGVYREGAGWGQWFVIPMLLGLGVGVIMVVADQLCAATNWQGSRTRTLSIFASATAGSEETSSAPLSWDCGLF